MPYTVCIPTAGTGSRLGTATKYLNKSLVQINNKPIISHIIENFDERASFVIAVGHKGKDVKDYLDFAHPTLDIKTVDIDPFEGPGSSLGKTLSLTKSYLQEPFIFCSCDTITNKFSFNLDSNWLGWDLVKDNSSYRTLTINEQNNIETIHEKLESESQKAYIGLAGIKDYKIFWENFNNTNEKTRSKGEVSGFNLENMNFEGVKFEWFDTGNPYQLSKARNKFKTNEVSVLPKENEKIWFTNTKVIKFSTDKDFITKRVSREKLLKGYVPEVTNFSENMYVYEYIKGDVLSKKITKNIFEELQNVLNEFWNIEDLDDKEIIQFKSVCSEFYKDKTYERVNLYLDRYPEDINEHILNSTPCLPIYELLDSTNWKELINGLPSRFHGDLHFENIIYNDKNNKFTFLDWRQDFGGISEYGDIYYDLAKLLHGIIVPHPSIVDGKYSITESENKKEINIFREDNIKNIEGEFKDWISSKGFDLYKVELLCSLIFLNIAPLHHHPYSKFLFSLGHWGLQSIHDKGTVSWSEIEAYKMK